MKKQFIFSLMFLITASIGLVPSTVFAAPNDYDGDGVPNEIDQCPNLLEDYDPQYDGIIDGCPADFVPWFDTDYDAIPDHLDRKSTRLNSSHSQQSRMPSSA